MFLNVRLLSSQCDHFLFLPQIPSPPDKNVSQAQTSVGKARIKISLTAHGRMYEGTSDVAMSSAFMQFFYDDSSASVKTKYILAHNDHELAPGPRDSTHRSSAMAITEKAFRLMRGQ